MLVSVQESPADAWSKIWDAAGWWALNTRVPAQVLLKKVPITFISHTIIRPEQDPGSLTVGEWVCILSLTIRTRPSFPHSQSLPSGSFHKPLILINQKADRMKTTITEKLIKVITWTTALSNSMKL